jgi:serine/threonine protein kinase
MAWVALNCPQCGAPLPRVAIWRAVKCASCGALITRTSSMVTRDTFRQALLRAKQNTGALGGDIECGGGSYHLMQQLGSGEISQVYLAQRLGPMPFLATVKLSSAPTAAAHYAREAQVLRELQSAEAGSASAYCLQHLPVVVAQGMLQGDGTRHALIMRHPNGFWGSLAALNQRYPNGLDPRHAVWIWRRLLDVLQYIHAQGWSHGDIRPEHGLVHPGNHGVRVIGWASAKKGASARDQAQDLQHSARVALVLLSGGGERGSLSGLVPHELAQLVTQASQDADFCQQQGAAGLDALLRAAARTAFGPPSFVHLTV